MIEFYDEPKVRSVCTVPFVPSLFSGTIANSRFVPSEGGSPSDNTMDSLGRCNTSDRGPFSRMVFRNKEDIETSYAERGHRWL
jgi:hypothetical protein